MPIPTFDQMLRPILALADKGEITRRNASEAMTEHFHLTPEEAALRLPSGTSTYVRNRTGWAMTFLTKAGLITKSAPRMYKITEHGKSFLNEHPSVITPKDLEPIPGYHEAWSSKKDKQGTSEEALSNIQSFTPEDTLDTAANV